MRKSWMAAAIVAAIAAVLFFVSVADYAFPGESARLMACWQGLDSSSDVRYPLMSVFAALFGGGNLVAPVCGVITISLIFLLVYSFVSWRIRGEEMRSRRTELSLIAAAVASVVFMLTPAVRSAATHLEPRLFDFMWLMIPFAAAIPFLRRHIPAWLYPAASGVVLALGSLDSALAFVVIPAVLVIVAIVARQRRRNWILHEFLFVLFFSMALFPMLGVCGTDFQDFIHRTAVELRLMHTVPGWILILLFSTIPFLLSIFASAHAFEREQSAVGRFFHVALSIAAIVAVATPIAPSALMEPHGILPVAASAFVAAYVGYLVAYWWRFRRRAVGIVVGGLLAFVLVVSCAWNLFTFDGDRGAFADRVAEKIVNDLGGRMWFVSDGVIDDHVRLVAARQGKVVHVISLSRDLDDRYLDDLSQLVKRENVGGSKNAELRLSLTLGVLPFLQDWMKADPTVASEIAVFGAPDLWYSADKSPAPEFLFFGGDPARVPDWSAWKEFDSILEAPKGWGSYRDRKEDDPVARMRFSLRRHLGMVANNRGVWLQDQKRDDEAWKMYELVLNEIDPDNICAIFNEMGMVGANHPSAVAKRRDLERMLKAAVDDTSRRYLLWRLGAYYGYIRNPDTFIRLGHAWARSGRPGDAIAQIRRAVDFVPSDRRNMLINMTAALYASENDQRKSRELYERVLKDNADDHDALVGLMRLELMDGNSERAIEYMQRAAETSGKGRQAKIELAMVAMMKNDLAGARKLLKSITDADARDMQAWSLLAAVTMQQIDAEKDASIRQGLQKELEGPILTAMEKQSRGEYDYYLQSTRGFIMMRKGKDRRAAAREAFIKAARARPDIPAAHDMVLGLDISLDDKEGARAHAREVLRRNRNAPLANYVMGSLALGNGNYDEAEAYLRRAADAPQPVVLALNDLAEVMRRKKNYPEAVRYARKTVQAAPGLYVGWETLGSVLMDADGDLAEAEASVRKACDLSRGPGGKGDPDVRMLVSLARVQLRNKDTLHAKMTIRQVESRFGELSDFEKREFEQIKKGGR